MRIREIDQAILKQWRRNGNIPPVSKMPELLSGRKVVPSHLPIAVAHNLSPVSRFNDRRRRPCRHFVLPINAQDLISGPEVKNRDECIIETITFHDDFVPVNDG